MVPGLRPCACLRQYRHKLGEIRRVVAHGRPGGAEGGDGEGGNEGETGFNRGTGLIEAAQLRESGAQHKIYVRKVSVCLDRPPIPRDCLFPTAKVEFRLAHPRYPDVSIGVARTEAQTLRNVSLCLFGATDENLAESDIGM